MPVDILSNTTLSAAIAAGDEEFQVASTTNIVAGKILVVDSEAMKVNSIPTSGYVNVMRGTNGTLARPHAISQRVFFGDHHDFKAVKDHALGLVGDSGAFPDFMLPGQRAFDGRGNEYIMVELTAVCYRGTTVVISRDGNFTAVQAAGGTQGTIGVTIEAATSDQYTWAQIYGFNGYAQLDATSACTSAYIPVPATSVSTPSVGLSNLAAATTAAAYVIHGMFIQGVAVSTGTSAASYTGTYIPVFLNYPYTTNQLERVESSNS